MPTRSAFSMLSEFVSVSMAQKPTAFIKKISLSKSFLSLIKI